MTIWPALNCDRQDIHDNIVEQDLRAIKRITRPMLGFKSFWSAAVTLAGIEHMHMIRKGQLQSEKGVGSLPQHSSIR